MRALNRISTLVASAVVVAVAIAQPQYQIFDIGVIQVGDTASQGFGTSPGGVAVGRSITSNSASQAFTWTIDGGRIGLPNLAGRPHAVSNDANDSGIVVGTAATALFGSSRLPVVWTNSVVTQLPLPGGETLGDANGVNGSSVAVGSVDGGSDQQAVIYNGASATIITQTTPTGCFFVTAFGINNSGRIVGQGIDPNNAARNVGIVYDMGSPRRSKWALCPAAATGACFRRGQRRPRGGSHAEPGLGHAVHLVASPWNGGDTTGHRHERRLGPRGQHAGLGGRPGFLRVLDPVLVGWDDDLSARGPFTSRLGLGLIHEHFVLGARHQRQRCDRRHRRAQRRDARLCDGANGPDSFAYPVRLNHRFQRRL